MPRPLTPPLRFRKSSLSVAVSACLLSFGASAIDLAQSPPGTVEPYVRPNVIISIDDSGSMGYRLDKESSTSSRRTTPNADGSWPVDTKRINVLKYALNSIFDPTHSKYDSGLLPDGKIRLQRHCPGLCRQPHAPAVSQRFPVAQPGAAEELLIAGPYHDHAHSCSTHCPQSFDPLPFQTARHCPVRGHHVRHAVDAAVAVGIAHRLVQ